MLKITTADLFDSRIVENLINRVQNAFEVHVAENLVGLRMYQLLEVRQIGVLHLPDAENPRRWI